MPGFDGGLFDGGLFDGIASPGDGPITVPLIASEEEVFTPLVMGAIIVPFVTSTATVYTPTVIGPAQTLTVPFISSEAQVFTPLVVGPDQNVLVPFMRSEERVFAPTVLLPYTDWIGTHARINGVWMPVLAGSVSIEQRLNTRGSARFTVHYSVGACGSPATVTIPHVGEYVEIYEDQRLEFAGWIESLSRVVTPQSTTEYEWSVECVDLFNLLDRRVITATWDAGTSVLEILRDIRDIALTGENVTLANVTTTATIPSQMAVQNRTATEVLNQVRDVTGVQVWVDPLRDIHAALPADGASAPVAWTADSHFFQEITIDTTSAGFATSVVVRSDQNLG